MREVVARFATPAAARSAIAALEDHRVDGSAIKLAGAPTALTARATKTVDRRIAVYLLGRVFSGIGAGIVIGAIVGAVGAFVLAAATDISTRDAFIGCELIGVFFGGALGAFIAFERAGTLSDAWSDTFEHRAGATWLRVVVADHRCDEIERVLRTQHALEVSATAAGANRDRVR